MNDLKPCPFCGGKAYLSGYSTDERFAYAEQVSVGCKYCGIGFSRCDDQNPKGGYALGGTAMPIVISQWNRRADLPTTLSAAMELPEVRALVNAMRAAKGYLEKGHDGMALNIIRSALVPFEGKGE